MPARPVEGSAAEDHAGSSDCALCGCFGTGAVRHDGAGTAGQATADPAPFLWLAATGRLDAIAALAAQSVLGNTHARAAYGCANLGRDLATAGRMVAWLAGSSIAPKV